MWRSLPVQFFDAMEQTFLNCRIVDRVDIPKRHPLDRGFVVQESNTVFFRKNLGDITVMMADYIDEDELHPYRTSGRIRKDISVGYVQRGDRLVARWRKISVVDKRV